MRVDAYKNDIGTKIEIDIGVPDSEISTAKIIYKKPDGTSGEWIATAESGTTKIYYITQNGDLDQSGTYFLQPYVELNSGWKGRGDELKLYVGEVI